MIFIITISYEGTYINWPFLKKTIYEINMCSININPWLYNIRTYFINTIS